MRRVLTTVAVAVSLAGCGLLRGSVVADPTTGSPVVIGDESTHEVKWPKGFTARRAWTETEVLDATGNVVLTTGARYWICPAEYLDGWVVGMVKACPDCELGWRPD